VLSGTRGIGRFGAVLIGLAISVGSTTIAVSDLGESSTETDADRSENRCFPEIDDDCPRTVTSLPSRITLNQAGLRSFRSHRRDPFSAAAEDAPRLAVLTRLAFEGRRPLLPRWRRDERLTTAGKPFSDSSDRFAHLTVPLLRPARLLPVWTPDIDRWGAVQETILATSSDCPCLYAASPGQVPDGHFVAGAQLVVTKNVDDPTDLDMSWDSSCLRDVDDYSVQEGILGDWTSHTPHTCTTGGATRITLTPEEGSWYYIAVPLNPDAEGSYGNDSTGTQRPASTTHCRPKVVIEPCP